MRCSYCRSEKPAEDFHAYQRKRPAHWAHKCKDCHRKESNLYNHGQLRLKRDALMSK